MRKHYQSKIRVQCFDDGGGDPPATLPNGAPAFTPEQQEYVNRVAALERRTTEAKLKKRYEGVDTQLQNALSAAQTAEERVAAYEAANLELSNSHKTAEQRYNDELNRQSKLSAKQLADANAAREAAETKFRRHLVDASITDASVKYRAISPSQILPLVRDRARVVPVLDKAGQPTGQDRVVIDYDGVDDAGTPVKLELTADQYLEKIRADESWSNLFASDKVGGTGQHSDIGGFGPKQSADFNALLQNPQEYMRLRKENPRTLGLSK